MRIAFYTQGSPFNGHTLEDRPLGGSESALLYMARELAGLGHEVTVFNNCDSPGKYDSVGYWPFEQIVPDSQARPFDVCVLSRFYDHLPNIRARVKVLWLHDVAGVKYYESAISVLNGMLDRYFFISDWQMQGFISTYGIPGEKRYLTRNGIDPSLFGGDIEKNPLKTVYINTPFRGLDVLLKVFPLIHRQVPGIELHLFTGMALYGDGYEDADAELDILYREARNMAGVFMNAPVPKRQLARELESASLSLYPGHFPECCSIASLECQAAGTPMVASDYAGLRDTVINGRTGVLVPFDDGEAKSWSPVYRERFVRETAQLLQDDARRKELADNARKLVAERFTWNNVAREWTNEFGSILKAGDT